MAAQEKSTLKKDYPVKKPKKLKVLFHWSSPARPFKKHSRDYFTTIGAIVFLLIIILFFIKEWLLILVIASLTFVAYVLASVEPTKVEHSLTNKGLETAGKNYPWEDMLRYWWAEKWSQHILNIENKEGFPKRLLVLVDQTDKKKVDNIINSYLNQEAPEPTFMDKAADWISEKVPLEDN